MFQVVFSTLVCIGFWIMTAVFLLNGRWSIGLFALFMAVVSTLALWFVGTRIARPILTRRGR